MQAYEMAMNKESRSTISGPMASLGGVGSRSLWGTCQWLLTIAVGGPCRPIPLDLQSVVGIVRGGRDGVVDGLPIARSTVEGQRSGKRRKNYRKIVEEYVRNMRKLQRK